MESTKLLNPGCEQGRVALKSLESTGKGLISLGGRAEELVMGSHLASTLPYALRRVELGRVCREPMGSLEVFGLLRVELGWRPEDLRGCKEEIPRLAYSAIHRVNVDRSAPMCFAMTSVESLRIPTMRLDLYLPGPADLLYAPTWNTYPPQDGKPLCELFVEMSGRKSTRKCNSSILHHSPSLHFKASTRKNANTTWWS